MSYFATPYTIHFDDTMAYGSHHFLSGFKFQCAARESLLYGDLIYDRQGVPEALDTIHLFTADAYSRNLNPAYLGDRLAILLTLEEWGLVSARFCYRVLGRDGQPICAGFQTHVCADAKSGQPVPLPEPLRQAYDSIRQITEVVGQRSFRDRVLAGGEATAELFPDQVIEVARRFLADRHPRPQVIELAAPPATPGRVGALVDPAVNRDLAADALVSADSISVDVPEVWVFPGQGAFDAQLLSERLVAWRRAYPQAAGLLEQSVRLIQQHLGGDAVGLLSGHPERCSQAVERTPDLAQLGIFLQGVCGAQLRRRLVQPAVLMGHSLGEIAALCVAGCFDLAWGVRVVCERVRAVVDHGPADGGLLAVMVDRPTVAEEIGVMGFGSLVIAGRNHDRQTVVSGPQDQLRRFAGRMRQLGIESVGIARATSFHHPALGAAASAWLRALRDLPIQPPKVAVFSPIGRRAIAPGDDIAMLLSTQLLRPFDLQGAINDLAMAGLSRLVDCGSTGALQRLLRTAGPGGIEVIGVERSTSELATETLLVGSEVVGEPAAASRDATAAGDLAAKSAAAPAAAASRPSETARRWPLVAVVGQGCLLPGRCSSPAELSATLSGGRSGIVDWRDHDPDWQRDYYAQTLTPDRSTSALAGLVDDRDIVCPANVDAQVFAEFSRAQKLLCIALAPCVELLRDERRVLCLVGATADGFEDQDIVAALRYAQLDPRDPQVSRRIRCGPSSQLDPHAAIRQVFERVVRPGLDITLIDAACASSLYSIGLGMSALENEEADVVVAGGVYCPGPGNNCLFSQFGGLTSTGCRPFDAAADGVVFSEGAAMLVMRRLDDARRVGQRPVMVIRGAGLASDGRSPSANVPQTAGQMIAVQRCYEHYRIDPASIMAIEGHGTSTPAGDATEIETLHEFFADHVREPIPLHSLKGAIGHTGWAAGAAAVIAAGEILRHRQFPAQANHHQPAAALQQAGQVLQVPTEAFHLTDVAGRIAIDGFGFGGANAHLVVQRGDETTPGEISPAAGDAREASADDDLVVVAWHQIAPQAVGVTAGRGDVARLDRASIPLPQGTVLLPDLADDMDVTQRLAIALVGQTLSQLGAVDESLRRGTSIVLALPGKTERGVEATLRVLAPRLSRDLAGTAAADAIRRAVAGARPSGPYTLQCMMPNVAAGRAALQFDLHGPNFVVDAGAGSLEAAFSSARWLLRSGEAAGTKLAIVAAIHANRWAVPDSDAGRATREYATALAVTTRHTAGQLGFNMLASVDELFRGGQSVGASVGQSRRTDAAPEPTTERQLAAIIRSLSVTQRADRAADDPSDRDQFVLHAPTWCEAPLGSAVARRSDSADAVWLVIAPADERLLRELASELPEFCGQCRLVLVGPGATPVAKGMAAPVFGPGVMVWEGSDESSMEPILADIESLAPQVVVAIERPESWRLVEVLGGVAGNELCETLFMVMKRLAGSLRRGSVEIWGVFPGSFRAAVHPVSGAISGLIRAAKREMPAGRFGLVGLRSGELRETLLRLQAERASVSSDESEVIYDGDRRLVQRLRAVSGSVPPGPPRPAGWLTGDSVVLATGGARGVTAVMVEALLRDYGCTVIACGRSPLEPGPPDPESAEVEAAFYAKFLQQHPEASAAEMRRHYRQLLGSWEAHRRLAQLAELPGRVRYLALDVTDPTAVDAAIAALVAELGRIDMILHGAGVQFSKRLEDRSLAEFRQTFDAKVGSLHHLVEACRRVTGRVVPVHALTSAYSIFGNDGQHDYGAANLTLDRLCQLTAVGDQPAWSSLAWSAWNGVGMTRGSEYQALAARRNLALLEPPQGQRLFRQAIAEQAGARVHLPLSAAERTRYRVRTLPHQPAGPVSRTVELAVQMDEMDYLVHHRARGAATLPGAWIVDLMVRAVLRLTAAPVDHVTCEDIRFQRFVRADNRHDARLRVVVDELSGGAFAASLIGNVVSSSGVDLASDEVFAQATLQPQYAPWAARRLLYGNGHSDTVWRQVSDPYCNGDANIQLSGPFECLQQIAIGSHGRQATFAPQIGGAWEDVVPALLLDASLRVAGMHVVDDALHVPTRIDRLVAPVGVSTASLQGAGWKIHAAAPRLAGDQIHCGTVEVTDPEGGLRARIEGSVVTRLG